MTVVRDVRYGLRIVTRNPSIAFIVRTENNPLALAGRVKRTIERLRPGRPVFSRFEPWNRSSPTRAPIHDVRARDPLTLAAVAVLLGVVAIVATALPAIRVVRVDPMLALRSE
jgi:hypothetical protein